MWLDVVRVPGAETGRIGVDTDDLEEEGKVVGSFVARAYLMR